MTWAIRFIGAYVLVSTVFGMVGSFLEWHVIPPKTPHVVVAFAHYLVLLAAGIALLVL